MQRALDLASAVATHLDTVGPASRQAGSPLSRSTSCSRMPPSRRRLGSEACLAHSYKGASPLVEHPRRGHTPFGTPRRAVSPPRGSARLSRPPSLTLRHSMGEGWVGDDEPSAESNMGANLEPLSMVSMHASTADHSDQGFPMPAHRTDVRFSRIRLSDECCTTACTSTPRACLAVRPSASWSLRSKPGVHRLTPISGSWTRRGAPRTRAPSLPAGCAVRRVHAGL
jgi:hypothetical protein